MPFSQDETQRLLLYAQSKWRRPNCQLCGHNQWAVDGPVQVPTSFRAGTFEAILGATAPSLPCAAFTCRVCGNTVLVNLIIAGVVQQ